MSIALLDGQIIDGVGNDPIERGGILVEDNRITYVGKMVNFTVPKDAERIDLGGRTVMPGLIDAHVHLVNTGDPDPMKRLKTSPAQSTIQAVVHAKKALMAGITTVRDLGAFGGGIDFALRDSVNAGIIPGPRMKVAGRSLTITGGHSDPKNGFPPGFPVADTYGFSVTVDTPEEARRAARIELRRGADCIKFCATGGILSAGTDNRAVGLSRADMAAAVEEAKNRGKRTAAHAQGTEGIKNALAAGVDSIEHGTWFDEEAIEMLIARGAYLVPTLTAGSKIRKMGTAAGIPEEAVKKAKADPNAGVESLMGVYQAGGKIAMGTDAGVPYNFHGANGGELPLMVEAGMTPMDVLMAATCHGAELIGFDTGQLVPGKLADMIVTDGDPLIEIERMAEPDYVVLVMKDGTLFKNSL